MQVRVKGYLTFRQLIGEQVLTFSNSDQPTLSVLLARLFSQWDPENRALVLDQKTGDLHRRVAILINGAHYTHTPAGLQTLLSDGDEISIFPPIAGG